MKGRSCPAFPFPFDGYVDVILARLCHPGSRSRTVWCDHSADTGTGYPIMSTFAEGGTELGELYDFLLKFILIGERSDARRLGLS